MHPIDDKTKECYISLQLQEDFSREWGEVEYEVAGAIAPIRRSMERYYTRKYYERRRAVYSRPPDENERVPVKPTLRV